jgi:hypothetical protein
MPIILTPEQGSSGGYTDTHLPEMPRDGYSYSYPRGLDFKPLSPLHEKIKAAITLNANESFSVMSARHPYWNKIDDMLNAYIPVDAVEQAMKKKDQRKPVSVVVPYSFATLETILTYLVLAFFQEPIFQYEGRGPEDASGAKLLELCVAQQISRSFGALALHTMFRDSLAYGIGPIVASWKTQYGSRVIEAKPSFKSKLGSMLGMSMPPKKAQVPSLFYEGSKLINLDPYLILPDSNRPIHEIGDSEYFGWIEEVPLMNLLDEESWPNSDLFNVKYLRHIKERTSSFTMDPSKRGYRYGLNNRRKHFTSTNSKTLVNMYMNIIPRDWGLGDEETPEKWFFTMADGEYVIRAKPLGLTHNQFPIVIGAPEFDGYSIAPVSRLEMVYGLQEVLNFLFNSHISNVRRSVNNSYVVDPSLINIPDFDKAASGDTLLIRTKRAAWGRGVKDAIEQLVVNDVTRNNVADAFQVIDLMNRTTSATENMMGIMRQGSERRSATEAKGVMSNAMNRMERIAKILSVQAMQPLAYFLAFHTQQLMSTDTYIKVIGEWAEILADETGRTKVSPFDILVEYDVIPRDGSLPTDVSGVSQDWIQLYQIMAQNQEIAGQIDMTRVFKHIARLLGAKNINDFMKKGQQLVPQAMPDEQVQSQVQQGNLVPANEAMMPEMGAMPPEMGGMGGAMMQ